MRAGRSALFVAHPGHELCVHGWLAAVRPVVFVMTDGSGPHGSPRIDSTRRLIEAAGASVGAIFGTVSDREVYAALLSRDEALFLDLGRRLADTLIADGVDEIVADAAEGYNPVHDVGRYVVDAAVSMLRDSGVTVRNLQFPVVEHHREGPPRAPGDVRFRLDDDAALRKLQAAVDYHEMAGEIGAALSFAGSLDAFRVEDLYLVARDRSAPAWSGPPHYETVGEERVRLGLYSDVIRYVEHVRPIEHALAAAPVLHG